MSELPYFNYEIDFPDFPTSEAVRADILKRLVKLEKLFDKIITCRVAVRSLHEHSHKHFYHIIIDLKIPTTEIVVNNEPEKNMSHTDVYIAIRDSFNSLERRLKKTVDKMREHHPH